MSSPRKNLFQKLQLQKKELQQEVLMYRNVMESMRHNQAFESILKLIIDNVTEGLGFDRAGIFLVNEKGDAIQQVMGVDPGGKYEVSGVSFPCSPVKGTHWFSDLVHGHVQWGMSNNLQRKVSKKVYEKDFLGKVICAAQVPIKVDLNKTIGVLAVDNLFTRRRLRKADLISLLNFATQAGLAIESFRLHERVVTLTITDSLTGVYNRRYFDDALSFEIKRAARYVHPLALLYADLDNFKTVNDQWGHSTGDEVLRQVAVTLRAGVRNIDIVSRIGGEEFAVILPETPPDKAQLVAERLVKAVSEAECVRKIKPVTLSVGIACFPQTTRSPEGLKQAADKSLYTAKQNGRNRVGLLVPA
jgi:diguanylate cyclase (GGDEF)-like protein